MRRNSTQMCLASSGTRAPSRGSRTCQPLSFTSHSMYAAMASGRQALIFSLLMRCIAVRSGRGQNHHGGLRIVGRGVFLERRIARLAAVAIAGHLRREGGVHQLLDRAHRAEALGQVDARYAARGQRLRRHFHTGRRRRGGTCRSIAWDRPPRKACRERACTLQPVVFGGIVGGKQDQDFGLQRIGVLKFVHEDAGEALLQVTADLGDCRAPGCAPAAAGRENRACPRASCARV